MALENPDNDSLTYAYSCMIQFSTLDIKTLEDYALNKKLLSNIKKEKWHISIENKTQADWNKSVTQRKATNFKRYSIENYNNSEKHNQTIAAKSAEEKQATYEKQKFSMFHRTEAEKLNTTKKRSESHLNRSAVEKEITKLKLRETLLHQTDIEKQSKLENVVLLSQIGLQREVQKFISIEVRQAWVEIMDEP